MKVLTSLEKLFFRPGGMVRAIPWTPHMAEHGSNWKVCSRCRRKLIFRMFHKGSRGYLQSACKECLSRKITKM